MSHTLSLVALSSLLLATAVSARDADGYRATMEQQPSVVSRLMASTEEASLQGDNCGVDGYPWLNADGQLIEG